MKYFLIGAAKHTIKALGYGILGGLSMLIVFFVLSLEGRPDLKVWHEAELDAEFTASAAKGFDEYIALETRLFAQLEKRVAEAAREAGLEF